MSRAAMRIGHGYDVHAFGVGEGFTLGGVWIKHGYRLIAHSDGDVLIHAVCDALLGSLALGDIGQHFPDTDPAYAGMDSTKLLSHVYALVTDAGYSLVNLDATIQCQKPKLAPYIVEMRATLAGCLSVAPDQISIKATTTEKLGFVGQEQGIAVDAVVLIESAA